MRLFESEHAPRFILGEDADLAEWLVHLHWPRFACRVREIDEDGHVFTAAEKESPDNYVYAFDGECFTSFVWIDPQPDAAQLEPLMAAAADFVEAMSAT
jgi:hypothetical protein